MASVFGFVKEVFKLPSRVAGGALGLAGGVIAGALSGMGKGMEACGTSAMIGMGSDPLSGTIGLVLAAITLLPAALFGVAGAITGGLKGLSRGFQAGIIDSLFSPIKTFSKNKEPLISKLSVEESQQIQKVLDMKFDKTPSPKIDSLQQRAQFVNLEQIKQHKSQTPAPLAVKAQIYHQLNKPMIDAQIKPNPKSPSPSANTPPPVDRKNKPRL